MLPHLPWLKLGVWLAQKGETDRATAALQAGLAETPHDPALQHALAEMPLKTLESGINGRDSTVPTNAKPPKSA